MRILRQSILILVAACAANAAAARRADAQSFTVSGNAAVTVNTAAPGGLDPAVDNSTTYSLTTSAPNQRLLAKLGCSLPNGITVAVRLTGTTSMGSVTLTTSDAEVLGPIVSAGTTTGSIIYTLTATIAAGTLATTPCNVVFTLV